MSACISAFVGILKNAVHCFKSVSNLCLVSVGGHSVGAVGPIFENEFRQKNGAPESWSLLCGTQDLVQRGDKIPSRILVLAGDNVVCHQSGKVQGKYDFSVLVAISERVKRICTAGSYHFVRLTTGRVVAKTWVALSPT